MARGWKIASAALRVVNGGISAKLYCFAFLSLLAVATLSISSIYFSRTTETAAQRLYGVSFVGILNATRLDLLLERHRRIVESTPSEVDRDRLQSGRNELGQIRQKLSALMIEIAPANGDGASLESRIAASLPPLFEAADQVAFYANEFAQDKAVEEANGYAHIANGIERYDQELPRSALAGGAGGHRRRQRDHKVARRMGAVMRVRGNRADRSDRACHNAPGAVAARRHHPGDDPALPQRHHHRHSVARRPRRSWRHGPRGGGVQGQCHPAHRPRGRAQAAQSPCRHRA